MQRGYNSLKGMETPGLIPPKKGIKRNTARTEEELAFRLTSGHAILQSKMGLDRFNAGFRQRKVSG